jgi:hypothetical protein
MHKNDEGKWTAHTPLPGKFVFLGLFKPANSNIFGACVIQTQYARHHNITKDSVGFFYMTVLFILLLI